MRILIADESPRIRNLIIEILGGKDNEFAECGEFSKICESCETFHPNIVIVDFDLIRMSCKSIKEMFPEAKVIVTSSYSANEVMEADYAEKINGFVVKENLIVLKDVINN